MTVELSKTGRGVYTTVNNYVTAKQNIFFTQTEFDRMLILAQAAHMPIGNWIVSLVLP